VGTPLSGLADSLTQAADALNGLVTLLTANPNADLGSVEGMVITESEQTLSLADTQILQMLTTMANGSGPSGCLATEASTALSDMDNPGAFGSDIAQLFEDSETSSACQKSAAATSTLGFVNGAGGVALALTAQATNTSVQPVLPTAAILLANLAPAGQLLSIGATLGQTTAQARQIVQSAVASFNQASSSQLSAVAGQSQGALNTSYTSTNQGETSFIAATPPPLDGVYAGSFTGTQTVSASCSAPINGSLGFTAQGDVITATVPNAGAGTLDPSTGTATFAIGGIGGPAVNCTFGGILLPNESGPASASGTWSCVAIGAGSQFESANGTWTASAQ